MQKFRKTNLSSHSLLYITVTFMFLMAMTVFSGSDASGLYLLLFPAWCVVVFFLFDIYIYEKDNLVMEEDRLVFRRFDNNLTVPFRSITYIRLLPVKGRPKTAINIFYEEHGQENMLELDKHEYRNFDDLANILLEKKKDAPEYKLSPEERSSNRKFRIARYNQIVYALIGGIVMGYVHNALLFGPVHFIRSLFGA